MEKENLSPFTIYDIATKITEYLEPTDITKIRLMDKWHYATINKITGLDKVFEEMNRCIVKNWKQKPNRHLKYKKFPNYFILCCKLGNIKMAKKWFPQDDNTLQLVGCDIMNMAIANGKTEIVKLFNPFIAKYGYNLDRSIINAYSKGYSEIVEYMRPFTGKFCSNIMDKLTQFPNENIKNWLISNFRFTTCYTNLFLQSCEDLDLERMRWCYNAGNISEKDIRFKNDDNFKDLLYVIDPINGNHLEILKQFCDWFPFYKVNFSEDRTKIIGYTVYHIFDRNAHPENDE